MFIILQVTMATAMYYNEYSVSISDDCHKDRIKYFTLRHYFSLIYDGWLFFREYISINISLHRKRKSRGQVEGIGGDDDDELTSIAYGIGVLAKLTAVTGAWVAVFIWDVRVGLYPSRVFIFTSYMVGLFGGILSVVLSYFIFMPTIHELVVYLIGGARSLIEGVGYFTIFSQGSFGLWCLVYMVYQRDFIHQFVLNICSKIMLKKSFQKRLAAELFIQTYLNSLAMQPIIAVIAMGIQIRQENFKTLTRVQFVTFKFTLVFTVVILALALSSLAHIIPCITCYLICAIEKYIEFNLDRMIGRYKRPLMDSLSGEHCSNSNNRPSPEHLRQLISDYSADTLLDDWPEIDQESNNTKNNGHMMTGIHLQNKSAAPRQRLKGILFFYRGISMSLCDIRNLIQDYDRAFGYIHIIMLCLDGLLTAQWFVMGLTRAKTLTSKGTRGTAGSGDSSEVFDFSIGSLFSPNLWPIMSHTLYSMVIFVCFNLVIFNRCDVLESRMLKLRATIFKLNVHLFKGIQSTNNSRPVDDDPEKLHELKLAWSLYDQIERISRQVNFNLVGDTKYSKQNLIMIFSNVTSLTLAYLQVLDMYYYVVKLPIRRT